ncbi:hypothetical protein [Spirosoma sp.]|uniref:hypothetical protein n=1 Tax=Spirosoma sp. TaxID=1899569 RepID=UPI002613B316|nr:hypothetical protein [Spirosoma sp.]MCX6217686.1 hypothetical protein [Spirosoma sp.]
MKPTKNSTTIPNYRNPNANKGGEQLPIQSLRINYVVGIDPDIERSGLAVWSRIKRQHTFIDAVDFYTLIQNLLLVKPGEALFRVDAGWLNAGFHHAAGLPDNFETWTVESKLAYYFKLGVQVGRNFGVGQAIVQLLVTIHGADNVKEVRPMPKNPKWSAADLKRYTGWEGRTNPDSRDAAKLCFQF